MSTMLNIKVIDDCTDNKFGVDGYEVELSTKNGKISAFINMKNEVSTNTGVFLHGLFRDAPFTPSFIDGVESAVNAALANWTPSVEEISVSV